MTAKLIAINAYTDFAATPNGTNGSFKEALKVTTQDDCSHHAPVHIIACSGGHESEPDFNGSVQSPPHWDRMLRRELWLGEIDRVFEVIKQKRLMKFPQVGREEGGAVGSVFDSGIKNDYWELMSETERVQSNVPVGLPLSYLSCPFAPMLALLSAAWEQRRPRLLRDFTML